MCTTNGRITSDDNSSLIFEVIKRISFGKKFRTKHYFYVASSGTAGNTISFTEILEAQSGQTKITGNLINVGYAETRITSNNTGHDFKLNADTGFVNSIDNNFDGASSSASWMKLRVASGAGSQTEVIQFKGNGAVYMAGSFQAANCLVGEVTIDSTNYAMIGSNSAGRGLAICRDGSASYADLIFASNGIPSFSASTLIVGTDASSSERYLFLKRFASNVADQVVGEIRYQGSSDGGHSIAGILGVCHHSNGRGRLEFHVNDASTYAERMTLNYDGNLSIDGSLSSSDLTLKDNVVTISNALDTINGLRGVTFNWNEDSGKSIETKQYGMIAQEVEELLPELVRDYGDGKKKQLNYTQLIPVLVESIKELSQKIDNIEKTCKCMNG